MNESHIRNVIEAALLAAGKPLQPAELVQLFDEGVRPEVEVIKAALAALMDEYSHRGIEIKETAAGFRIQVRREMANEISRLWPERPARYSRALLETLALIAYRQPITRAEIEAVRGVAVNPNIVKTLLDRNWVRVVGHRDVPGRPELLGTTREFLDYFSLKSLDELPPLAELKTLGDIKVQFELPDAGPVDVPAVPQAGAAEGEAAGAAVAGAAEVAVATEAAVAAEAADATEVAVAEGGAAHDGAAAHDDAAAHGGAATHHDAAAHDGVAAHHGAAARDGAAAGEGAVVGQGTAGVEGAAGVGHVGAHGPDAAADVGRAAADGTVAVAGVERAAADGADADVGHAGADGAEASADIGHASADGAHAGGRVGPVVATSVGSVPGGEGAREGEAVATAAEGAAGDEGGAGVDGHRAHDSALQEAEEFAASIDADLAAGDDDGADDGSDDDELSAAGPTSSELVAGPRDMDD
jgi:segregation and condensation protein B